MVSSQRIPNYKLETVLESPERGVAIRRDMLAPKLPVDSALAWLPYKEYDYSKVLVTCCCPLSNSVEHKRRQHVFFTLFVLPVGDGDLL